MPKNYVILCYDDLMIFPIKALMSPYPGGIVYCPGEPQFFGGGVEGGEGPLTTLQRELDEESAHTFRLNGYVNQPVFRGSYPTRKGRVECCFYYSVDWTFLDRWPDLREWQQLPNACREMCFVATVLRSDFDRVMFPGINTPPPWTIFEVLTRVARQQAPRWARDQIRPFSSDEFDRSLTFQAFICFVNSWLTETLPGWPLPPRPLVPREDVSIVSRRLATASSRLICHQRIPSGVS
ncbi:MAG: NUDIX domain-containing protein [Tardiphaga sp.]|nr:NUDIX domain-containing protein [Tardiphaga sp.]